MCRRSIRFTYGVCGWKGIFFITNLKPVRFWDFVSHIVEGLGYPRPSIKLPVRLVLFVFSLLKWTHEKEGLGSNYDTAHQYAMLASSTRTFNCNAAKRHLGYTPVVTLEDGIASTLKWFSQDLEKSDDTSIQSTADQLLGCGKVADILLWRNEKKTFVSFFFLSTCYIAGSSFLENHLLHLQPNFCFYLLLLSMDSLWCRQRYSGIAVSPEIDRIPVIGGISFHSDVVFIHRFLHLRAI